MPKLKHKDKVERQKSFNYTAKHDELAKKIEQVKNGELEVNSPTELMKEAGYKAPSDAVSQPGVQEILRREWPAIERIKQTRDIANDAQIGGQFQASLKAIDIANKIAGDYAASKTDVNVSGTVTHEHFQGGQDYLEFKKQLLLTKDVIEGEIVDIEE